MNLNEEIICGYRVSAEKKRVNAVYLDLLQEFERLCKRAGLPYWLFFGSLIGAVRHKGFIPWDDDVDILMPRKYFDQLLRMTNERFGAKEPYFLQNPVNDPDFCQRIIRFRRSDTTAVMDYDLEYLKNNPDKKPYNMGLCLAIFPLDNLPKNKLILSIQQKIAHMGVDFRTDGGETKKKPLWNIAFRVLDSIMTERMVVRCIHMLYRVVPKNHSGMVQCFEGFYPECNVWRQDAFQETMMLPFEDLLVPVPAGYDHILSTTYGSYLEFPPGDKRTEKHDGYLSADAPFAASLEKLLTATV